MAGTDPLEADITQWRRGLADARRAQTDMSDATAGELRKRAPVDTGATRRSIDAANGVMLGGASAPYAPVVNAVRPHSGWVERAIDSSEAERIRAAEEWADRVFHDT